MLDVLGQYAVLCFAMVFVGFLSVKFFVYGTITTGVLSIIYNLLPGFDGATVLNTMWPRLLAIWTIYPRLLDHMLTVGGAEHGVLGMIIYGIVAVGPVIPYIAGIIFGFLAWPELTVLRAVA